MTWINWRELEANIPLEQLPEFHRAFLASRGVENLETMMLRRIQQSVERELNTMLREGEAKQDTEIIFVLNTKIPIQWLQFISPKET
jgi:hypothetical protein